MCQLGKVMHPGRSNENAEAGPSQRNSERKHEFRSNRQIVTPVLRGDHAGFDFERRVHLVLEVLIRIRASSPGYERDLRDALHATRLTNGGKGRLAHGSGMDEYPGLARAIIRTRLEETARHAMVPELAEALD